MRVMLGTVQEEMLGFRQELKRLADALGNERSERLAAFEEAEVRERKFVSTVCADLERFSKLVQRSSLPDFEARRALENETKERVALEVTVKQVRQEVRSVDDALDAFTTSVVTDLQEVQRALDEGLEDTETCMANIDELSRALEKETKDRVALETSVHQTIEAMQADLEQEAVQQTSLVKELKNSLDRDLIVRSRRGLQSRKEELETIPEHGSEQDQLTAKELEAAEHKSGAYPVKADLDENLAGGCESAATGWRLWNIMSST